MNKIGIIGIGFVGNAIKKFFEEKQEVVCYDKYKKFNKIEELLATDILFLCLPTLFDEEKNEYDKTAIYETCSFFSKNDYLGLVVVKSTVEPETTSKLSNMFKSLKICHNPEFLTARSAVQDFNNQNHIIIGKGSNCDDRDLNILENLYRKYYPSAEISLCTSLESESMKIMCNSFYASKVMIFNEYYLLCQKNGSDYKKIVELMLKNNWINKMHTDVPGPDGQLGFGGACFPKDIRALNSFMQKYNSPNNILNAVINECDQVRNNESIESIKSIESSENNY
jgi:UDPglucose 6-dehydrogenase